MPKIAEGLARSKALWVRFRVHEHAAIAAAAANEKKPMTEWAREVLVAAAAKQSQDRLH